MMRIFIDTNILISAMLFPNGTASLAYYKCIKECRCFVSEKVLSELRNVFYKKFPDKATMLDIFIPLFLKNCTLVQDCTTYNKLEDTIRDIKDRIIYRTAKSSGCDTILTGDKDFTENKQLDINILSPQDFLKL